MEVGLQIFESEEFGEIRTLGDWENPEFCLVDLCRALELNPSKIAQRLGDDVLSKYPIPDSLGRIQMTNFVNEDGLYDVILESRKPIAKRFRKWLTKVVIPSIRKTGAYIEPNVTLVPKDISLPENVRYSTLSRKTKKMLEAVFPTLSPELQELVSGLIKTNEEFAAAIYLIPQDLPGEVWKWIRGYEGLYQGSTKGRIKSFHSGEGRILTPLVAKGGYLRVKLTKDGKIRTCLIHRLVAELFIANPENKPEVHHRDDNPANNCVENLEWVTEEENTRYALEAGNLKMGESHYKAKLTEADVRYIRANYIPRHPEFGMKALAEKFGVNRETIYAIVYYKTWKHVDAVVAVQ